MFKKTTLAIGLFFAMISASHAGLLIEPYLGYAIGGDGESTFTPTTVNHTYSGLNYGARLGYSNLGFMIGLDYSASSHDLEGKITSSPTYSAKDGIDRSQIGIFVGFNFPVMLRAWGTYYFGAGFDGADAEKSGDQVYDNTDEVGDGSGYGLGVGFTGLPFVSINAEYRTFEYDTSNHGAATVANFAGAKLSEILLSISLPLNI